jgi:hypothetical protein
MMQPYQSDQSHENLSPKEIFQLLGANRVGLAQIGLNKLQVLVDFYEKTPEVDFGIDKRFTSMVSGKLATQYVESKAQSMGTVVGMTDSIERVKTMAQPAVDEEFNGIMTSSGINEEEFSNPIAEEARLYLEKNGRSFKEIQDDIQEVNI